MWLGRQRGTETGKCLAVVGHGVKSAADEIKSNREGIDVIHSAVVRDQACKDEAAKNERDDRYAHASCGSKDPDEEDE